MKISKLFHWLYAILMFLPILVFIPNAFYYGFNEHAIAQEKTENIITYKPSNDVYNVEDIIVGSYYYYTDNFYYLNTSGNEMHICRFYLIDNTNINTNIDINQPILLTLSNNANDCWITYKRLDNGQNGYMSFARYSCQMRIYEKLDNINILVPYLQKTEIVDTITPVTTNMSITDSMSYAWKSTWQNELFSWSYGSFLVQPFLYITNLFNVPATNTLLYCLSYWLNISIIWLCFDVVMYVPLLVHRWLDKGIIE